MASSSCDRVVLKLKNGQEFRRVVLQAQPIRLENVHESIGQIFSALKDQQYSLSYTDEDGDVILVSSDLEFREAMEVAISMSGKSTPVLRFEVTPTGKKAAPAQQSKVPVAEIEDVDEDIEALVNDVTAELNAPKVDESKKDAEPKDELLLSSLVPEEILRHDFLRKMALEFRSSLDKWVALIPMMNIGMRCREDSQKLLKDACDAIIAGANMPLPSDLMQNPMIVLGLGYLQDRKEDIVQKLDRMGEGFATLEKSDLNGKMPVCQMVMMLWRHDGDADAVLKNAAFGGFCSSPPPPPPPPAAFRSFGFPPPFHTFQMNMHLNANGEGATSCTTSSSSFEKKEEKPQEPACPRRCPFMASRAASGEKVEDAEFEHPAICDHCGDGIKNIRWKCHTCADYDLCTACLSVTDVHDVTHSFIRITPQSATSHMPFGFRGHRGRRFGGPHHPAFRFGCRGRRFATQMKEGVERRKNAATDAETAQAECEKRRSVRQALLDSIVSMSQADEEKEPIKESKKVEIPVPSVPVEEVPSVSVEEESIENEVEAKEDEVEVLDPEVVANIAQLTSMGFAEDEARDVLAGVNNNVNEAIEILLGA